MPQEEKDTRIGALWENKSKNGVIYLKGVIDGKQVVAFKNTMKSPDSRQPDWTVRESTPLPEREERPEAQEWTAQRPEPKPATRPKSPSKERYVDPPETPDSEMPF